MSKTKFFSLADNFNIAENIANNIFQEIENQMLAEKKFIAGLKGNFFAIRNLLINLSEKFHFQLDFFDEKQFADKIFDDANYSALFLFQSFYPPQTSGKGVFHHWGKYRFDDWVRNKMNYCYINALNLGNEFSSPLFEATEILRIKNNLDKPENKNFTLIFIPDKPESPVSAHSAITAAALLKMNINICLPENFPLDFEALSIAEVVATRNKKTFSIKFEMNAEILKNSDMIVHSSWAQLGKFYDQQKQQNLLDAQKIDWNYAKLPKKKIILPALSYPYIRVQDTQFLEQALLVLLKAVIVYPIREGNLSF